MGEQTFTNPVYDASFPDPFVLRYCGEFWAYSTGVWADGRAFGILRSPDLVRWEPVGGAMEQLADRPPHYWAPEVTYDNGRFFLYYSAGDEVHMHLRVAVAMDPAGPFVDTGRRLTSEEFAIDAHVFEDRDGSRYMFYATDFLEHTHVGTGTVVDRMIDWFTLEGDPRPVTRARYDWQVYDPARKEKGGVRWHTVEGPFVLERKGRYYEMFSGGNWQNVTYGVSFATSDRVLADEEWVQACDGDRVLPILRTIPDRVVGPGHNSVVAGPDGRQRFCVYHRWTATGRALAIDRLEWIGERLAVLGPTDEPTPAPATARVRGFTAPAELGAPGAFDPRWSFTRGSWSLGDSVAAQEAVDEVAEAVLEVGSSAFAVETSFRWQDDAPSQGAVGIELLAADAVVLVATVERTNRCAAFRWGDGDRVAELALPDDFVYDAFHHLRVEVDGVRASATLDGRALGPGVALASAPSRVALLAAGVPAEFAGFSVARGWQDEFARDGSAADYGWRGDDGAFVAAGGELRTREPAPRDGGVSVAKPVDVAAYELVVNVRRASGDGSYEIAPALEGAGDGPVFTVERDGAGWTLASRGASFALGAAFDPAHYQQFRFRKRGGSIDVFHEAMRLGAVGVPRDAARVGLGARGADVRFDLVRVTDLPYETGDGG
jgi:arabinan endo-1,5-alpha-L-arabinosidase